MRINLPMMMMLQVSLPVFFFLLLYHEYFEFCIVLTTITVGGSCSAPWYEMLKSAVSSF